MAVYRPLHAQPALFSGPAPSFPPLESEAAVGGASCPGRGHLVLGPRVRGDSWSGGTDTWSSYNGMATQLLSRYEREYIVSGVNEDLRADGRTCRDFRHFSLESGVVSNTSGSARIQLVS